MSKSGNAALAPQARDSPPPEPVSSLPSPSPSFSDLPDASETPKNTFRTLVGTIREVLSSTRAKKKPITVDGYAKCFAALDSLDALLDCRDRVESSLQAFKLDLLAEIIASVLHAPHTTYASAAASPLPAPSLLPTAPPKAAAVRSRSCEVTVAIDKACDILPLPLSEIKSKVEAAILIIAKSKYQSVVTSHKM